MYPFIMAATERYRLTIERETGTARELFDLVEDPEQLNNLANDPACKGIREEMRMNYIEPLLAGCPT